MNVLHNYWQAYAQAELDERYLISKNRSEFVIYVAKEVMKAFEVLTFVITEHSPILASEEETLP